MKKKTSTSLSVALVGTMVLAPMTATAAFAAESDVATIHDATNAARAANGVTPSLTRMTSLDDVAQVRAQEIQTSFGHLSGAELSARMPAGWSAWGENIACGQSSSTVIDDWMKSQGHRENILNPNFNSLGVGFFVQNGQPCSVQIFGKYVQATVPAVMAQAPYAGMVDSSTIRVAWTPPENGGASINGYVVRARNVNTGEVTTVVRNTIATSYDFTGLNRGNPYVFTVSARNSVGIGLPSPETIQVFTAPGAPDAPAAPSAGLASSNSITVGWNIPTFDGGTGVTEYDVTQTGSDGSVNTVTTNAAVRAHTFTDLRPGTNYTYTVVAKNVEGASAASAASTGVTIPAVTSQSPLAPKAVAVDKDVKVSWLAPAFDGGSPITSYKITATPTTGEAVTIDTGSSALEHTFTDLTPGMNYTFKVAAVNGVGESVVSANTNTIMAPYEVADAPSGSILTKDNFVTVKFDAPLFDGGTEVTGYVVVLIGDDGTVATRTIVGLGTNEYTFDNLTPGVTYVATVAAVNLVGTGAAVTLDAVRVAPVAPNAVRNATSAITDVNTVTVDFDAPAFDGGEDITDYTVVLVDKSNGNDAYTANVTDTTATFTVRSGRDYEARIVANNSVGSSVAVTTNSVNVPLEPTAPEAPFVSAFPSDTSATIGWSALENGGSPITGYTVRVIGIDGQVTTYEVAADQNSLELTELDPFSEYTVSVTATNALGTSPAGVKTFKTKAQTPDTVTGVTVEAAGPDSIDVEWTEPVNTGGAPIRNYTVIVTSGETTTTVDVAAPETSVTIDGLEKGTDYTVNVIANNVDAASVASAPVSATTWDVAGAPQNVEAVNTTEDGEDTLAINWVAPETDGGAEIEEYIVTVTEDGESFVSVTLPATSTSFDVIGEDLLPGKTYTTTVIAVNSVGNSEAGTATPIVIPAEAPDAVENIALELDGAQSVTATWDAPEYDGGAEITGYDVVLMNVTDGTSQTVNTAELAHTFAGLNYGDTYRVIVNAVNSAGNGVTITSNNVAIPEVVASAPANVVATPNGTNIVTTWETPVSDGGSPITGYELTLTNTTTDEIFVTTVGASGSHTFGDLTPGETYTVSVAAVNGIGTSTPTVSNSATIGAVEPGVVNEAVATLEGRNNVKVTWNAGYSGGGTISSYDVTLTDVNADVAARVAPQTIRVTDEVALFEGLDYSTTYVATVVANNEVGSSPAATSNNVTTAEAPVAPATVDALEATTTGSTITANWVAPSNDGGAEVTGYVVTLSNGVDDDVVVETTDLTYTFENVAENTDYTVSVAAVNGVGTGEIVTSNVVTTDPISAPVTNETVADQELTDINNTVDAVLDGTIITVTVPDNANEWVYAYIVTETPSGLGWAELNGDAQGSFDIAPLNLVAGQYVVALYDIDGNFIGWDAVTVPEAVDPTVPTTPVDPANPVNPVNPAPVADNSAGNGNVDVTGDGNPDTNADTRNTTDKMADTGAETAQPMLLAMLLMLLGGTATIAGRFMKRKATNN